MTTKKSSEYSATVEKEENDKGSYLTHLFPTSSVDYYATKCNLSENPGYAYRLSRLPVDDGGSVGFTLGQVSFKLVDEPWNKQRWKAA